MLSKSYLSEHDFEWFFTGNVGLDEVIDLLAKRGGNRDSTENYWSLTYAVSMRIVDESFLCNMQNINLK